jgi:hypothetical protein
MGQSCSLYVGCRCDLVLRAPGRQTRPLIIPRHAAPGGAFSHAPPGSAGAPVRAACPLESPCPKLRASDELTAVRSGKLHGCSGEFPVANDQASLTY